MGNLRLTGECISGLQNVSVEFANCSEAALFSLQLAGFLLSH